MLHTYNANICQLYFSKKIIKLSHRTEHKLQLLFKGEGGSRRGTHGNQELRIPV